MKWNELSEEIQALIELAYHEGYDDAERMEKYDFDLFKKQLNDENRN